MTGHHVSGNRNYRLPRYESFKILTKNLKINKIHLCVYYVCYNKQPPFSLLSVRQMVFVMEVHSVICEVRTESIMMLISSSNHLSGAWGSVVVKALRY